MKVMIFLKADERNEPSAQPTPEMITAMTKYHEQLVKAGVLLAGEQLHPSTKGALMRFAGDTRTVIEQGAERMANYVFIYSGEPTFASPAEGAA